MIDLRFAGTQEEVLRDVLAYANMLAGGLRMQQAMAVQKVNAASTAPVKHASDCAVHNAPALEAGPCDCGAAKAGDTPVAEPVPPGQEMKEPARRGRPKKEPAPSPAAVIDGAVKQTAHTPSASDVFEEVPGAVAAVAGAADPAEGISHLDVPETVDEMKALMNECAGKVGAEKTKAIISQYATKVSLIPADKYAEAAAQARAAIGAA